MKNAVFTIVAKNYIGLAAVLEKSVKRHGYADFFIFIADEPDPKLSETGLLPPNVLIAKEKAGIEESQWNKMAFQYGLIEFCTAIKPFCFKYLFDRAGYEKVIYLDPDVYLFSSLQPVFSDLDQHAIILTPHIITPQTPFAGNYPDYSFLVNGTYNMGFIGLKKSVVTEKMLAWWKDRLEDQCFFDNERGMATDQKWMNMLPAYFDPPDLLISKNAGLNVAPWNYHERKVLVEDNRLFVVNRILSDTAYKVPLVFVHFSGYDYNRFRQNEIKHKAENSTSFDDFQVIFDLYAEALGGDTFSKYIHLAYSYNYFENGKVITPMQRRIFRRLVSEHITYANPFETTSGSYYERLKKNGLLDHAAQSDEKITNKTIPGFDKKLGLVNLFFRVIKKVIGIRRYSIMARFLRRYLREENQVYLYDKNFKSKLW